MEKAKIEGLNLLDYVEDVAKANTGPMNADQQKTDKATQYHQETPWRTSHRSPNIMWSSHSQSLWRTCLNRKIKKSVACCKKKKHAVMDDGINMEDK